MGEESRAFYEMIEEKHAFGKLEKKLATIDETFNVDAANRSFLSYFESDGVRIFTMTDFVHPADVDMFKKFVMDEANAGERLFCKLKEGSGEYRIAIVKLRSLKHSGDKSYADIEIIDIEDTLYINDNAIAEITKMRVLLGMTNEVFFTYDSADNKFKMFKYTDLKREMIYNMDIDQWYDDMIAKKYVPDEELSKFQVLVSDIKTYAQIFSTKINCSIRTMGEGTEQLKFSGAIFGAGDKDKTVIGRVIVGGNSAAVVTTDTMDELHYDSLTGVYNKKTITEYAKKFLKERTTGRVTIVVMDVDHFKNVNDTYGHLYGDKVLARVGQKLKEVVGEDGIVGRIGGDEFMIVLTEIHDDQMLRSMLRAIKSQIKWEFAEDFTDFSITCSQGAAICPNNGTDYEDLFKKADYCLYIAKEKGRDRYVFFRDDMHRQSYEASLDKNDSAGQNSTREVKELMYVRKFFADVQLNRSKAIKEMLLHMKETYNLDSINIYYGEGMDRVYTVGSVLNGSESARYVFTDEYKELLGDKPYIQVGFIGKILDQVPDFCDEMKRRRVFSTMQCIIGTLEDIRGLVTFNRCKESSQWADYEVDTAVILTSYLSMITSK